MIRIINVIIIIIIEKKWFSNDLMISLEIFKSFFNVSHLSHFIKRKEKGQKTQKKKKMKPDTAVPKSVPDIAVSTAFEPIRCLVLASLSLRDFFLQRSNHRQTMIENDSRIKNAAISTLLLICLINIIFVRLHTGFCINKFLSSFCTALAKLFSTVGVFQ